MYKIDLILLVRPVLILVFNNMKSKGMRLLGAIVVIPWPFTIRYSAKPWWNSLPPPSPFCFWKTFLRVNPYFKYFEHRKA